jgi:hypothetical protein
MLHQTSSLGKQSKLTGPRPQEATAHIIILFSQNTTHLLFSVHLQGPVLSS